ncbi:MAG: HAMP domain-containing protein [Candidatus Saccharibacteria bacterium]|nr:HAMP domain-containing protein [Pseudorhodobacter sp.]
MAFRFKSYMPRSLFGRAGLILVVPIITIQIVVSVVFIQRHFDGVSRQLSRGVALELQHMVRLLETAPTLADAQQQASALGQDLAMRITLPASGAPPPGDARDTWDLSGREVGTTLHNSVPQLMTVDLAAPSGDVELWLISRYGSVLVQLGRNRVTASNPHQLLVLTGFASILMTLVAYVFLRNQLTPITRLARVAEAFGRGQNLPYRPRGANEVRAAGAAFLDMRARIERHLEQRTLMLSGVSHDLRAPLTRMMLGLSFMPEGTETEALKRDVEDMVRLVDEFLAFARGDAMEATEDVDPAALVGQVVSNAVRGGLQVALGECLGAGQVRLRPQAVIRALENLVGNAVRYGNRAVVSFVMTEKSLRLTVEDDGPGIPKDQREEALLPFTRLDAARDPNRGGGVGLGLSIAAGVARSHGGVLRLGDSELLGGLRADLVLGRQTLA